MPRFDESRNQSKGNKIQHYVGLEINLILFHGWDYSRLNISLQLKGNQKHGANIMNLFNTNIYGKLHLLYFPNYFN